MNTKISDFGDITDIDQATWHYESTPRETQTALRIEFPGRRVSISLYRQILLACNSHSTLVSALETIAARLEAVLRKDGASDVQIATHPDLVRARSVLKSALAE